MTCFIIKEIETNWEEFGTKACGKSSDKNLWS